MRAVSVLEVADAAIWEELAARIDLEGHLGEVLGPTRRVVEPSFEREVLPQLGTAVLVRYARRDAAAVQAAREELGHRIAGVSRRARHILYAAQRHALDDVVRGRHAWDPEADAASVRALLGAGLLQPAEDADDLFRLHHDLPPPPDVAYDFEEAVMEETDDLSAPGFGAIALLHDLAALAAALSQVSPRRTHTGAITATDAKKLAKKLGSQDLARVEDHPRWGRALRALEALGAVGVAARTPELHLDLGLERTLAGDTRDAVDRLVHRLVDRDLHVVLPAVRHALREAGDGAIDEVVFLDLLRDQHREVLFPRWRRDQETYPLVDSERPRLFDDDGWDVVETRMIDRALDRMQRLGLLRRAPGVFAGTLDGKRWAGAPRGPTAHVWVSSDLEVMVPPDTITPWERFQLERLGRCLQRDVVDRYRLERKLLVSWLATHDVEEALEVLRTRCPALPQTVVDTLREWSRSAMRVVLTRGVLLEEE